MRQRLTQASFTTKRNNRQLYNSCRNEISIAVHSRAASSVRFPPPPQRTTVSQRPTRSTHYKKGSNAPFFNTVASQLHLLDNMDSKFVSGFDSVLSASVKL
ncbi:hypothetical protein J6590_000643 [Homalodisca vitripennis]|nr:hypothetical protein J6590_000643 [Homalodisca vitripennis]